jgi:hypothetical protein
MLTPYCTTVPQPQVSLLIACSVILSGFAYALLNTYQQAQFTEAFDTAVATARQSLVSGYAAKAQGGAVVAAQVAALVTALALPPDRAYEAAAQHASLASLNASVNSLAASHEFLWAPLVNATSLAAFNAFAATMVPAYEGAAAVAGARAAAGVWSLPDAAVTAELPASPAPPNASAPFYVPIMQLVPFAPSQAYVLLDLMSYAGMRATLAAALATRTPQQTDMLLLTGGTGVASIMFVPVLAPGQAQDGEVVGFAGIVFSWRDMAFDGLQQSGGRGLVGEVRSPGGASQLFSLHATAALAEEDAATFSRDSFFDKYGVTLSGDALGFGAGWSVTLWPTRQLYAEYVTFTPIISAVVIAVLTLFVCCMFGVYDYLAITRAALLTRMWQATEAVVADVFPQSIKSRLVEEQLQRHRRNSGGGGTPAGAGTTPVSSLFSQAAQVMSNALMSRGTEDNDAAAAAAIAAAADDSVHGGFIADAYPGTTVVFADVVGFTEWSASVPPTEVFRVLEAVFTEFDALAKSLSVFKVRVATRTAFAPRTRFARTDGRFVRFAPRARFAAKVETIGDCYMCCCGALRAATHRNVCAPG